MSNPEEMLVQLVNSINMLSNLVRSVQESMAVLNEKIGILEKNLEGMTNIDGKLSTLEQNITKSLTPLKDVSILMNMLATINAKIDNATTVAPQPVTETKPPISSSEVLDSSYEVKDPIVEEQPYVSPGLKEEESFIAADDSDIAIAAISTKFKHISQMISPQTSCASGAGMLEELKQEIEAYVGMSPMLYELNSWIQRIRKMPETEILEPDVHSELVAKLDDWLTRVIKAIETKHERGE